MMLAGGVIARAPTKCLVQERALARARTACWYRGYWLAPCQTFSKQDTQVPGHLFKPYHRTDFRLVRVLRKHDREVLVSTAGNPG